MTESRRPRTPISLASRAVTMRDRRASGAKSSINLRLRSGDYHNP